MSLPLIGIRIVDLSHDWSGPHATRLLADFGAEVIKVEYLRRIDGMRGGRLENEAYNHHPRWLQINRNKLSVTLDFAIPDQRRMFLDLVRVADVLVENSRAGVMAKLGLDYVNLIDIKPDLIYLSMPAFGESGPEARFAGYGAAIEALSGMQGLTAYAGNGRPKRVKEMDVTNGVVGACALMTALVHRQHTGEGQHIDLSQLEAGTHGLIGEHLLEFAMNRTQTLPLGNRSTWYAPHGCYRCQGEDRWVAIAVRNDAEWRAFCHVMNRADLCEAAHFATTADRACHHDELDHIIEQWTQTRLPHDVMRECQAVGIPAGAVLNAADLASDPHLAARGYFLAAEDGTAALFPGLPFGVTKAKGRIRCRGPRLGEHNRDVLCQLLGWAEDAVPPIREGEIGTAFDLE